MKKLAIITFFILAMLNIQAQDYLISFAGTGGSATVDSVQVKNLTQFTGLTLNGADVLHLMGVVGIDQAVTQNNPDLRIYPNPMNESSLVEFEAASSGIATIELCDITGKLIAQTQNMLPSGRHTFAISSLSSGMFTLRIKSAGYFYSGKIVCTGIGLCNPKINYVSGNLKSPAQGKLKGVQALVTMQYNDGDQLLFKCFSGIFSTVIPLIPTQSQLVTVDFVDCTDSNGNHYAVVTIGTQKWMAENLNVGTRINGNMDQTNNGIIEKYCYNNYENNCDIYGGLYQWNEMMQYLATPGVQGICPSGWHVPNDAELFTLTNLLGEEAGGKMKSTGTIEAGTGLWYDPNTGATNETGFTAIPVGGRYLNGAFNYYGYGGYLWSSSEDNSYNAWNRGFGYHNVNIGRSSCYEDLAFSVRCMSDESIPFTCGSPIAINHVTGDVAPVDKTVTYGTVNNIPGEPTKCWITSNLGADHQATAKDDATEASAGWYWQFNRKQGYKHDGTTRTPNTTWINTISEDSDWMSANDPCTIELGVGWRIPTNTEWATVDAVGNWSNWNGPWNSALKMHAAGNLRAIDGALIFQGSYGSYWSSTQLISNSVRYLFFFSAFCDMSYGDKADGYTIRCVRDN